MKRVARYAALFVGLLLVIGFVQNADAEVEPAPTGLGATWTAALAGHDQVLVAAGESRTSVHNTVTLWTRTSSGWQKTKSWPGYDGLDGWAAEPDADGRRTPIGAFELTDAGGYAADPGSNLPYTRDESAYALMSHGVRTFDHVIAINYNRVAGTPPTSDDYPLGKSAGYHFWLHVSHGSGSAGCITVPESGMEYLLTHLQPDEHPLIVMGPASVLRK